MKKFFRKTLTLLLAITMMVAMCVPVMADGTTPSTNDKTVATVKNVEKGLTVTAYQIVKAAYNANGFVRYESVKSTPADPLNPTSDEITALSKDTTGLTSQVLADNGDGTYSKALAPGYWMVLVTGSGSKVYNPMLLGVYYSVSGSDNTMTSNPVDASENWTLTTKNAYAKSTQPEIKKTIVKPSSGNNSGDDTAIGDTVNFNIATKIPSYSSEYTTPTFKISDVLSTGLTLKQDSFVVTVGDDTVTAGADTYTINNLGDQTFTIDFASSYVLKNGTKDVVVTYSATLNDKATVNFDANTNEATLTYSNNPTDGTNAVKSKTYHYTFAIDGKVNGDQTTVNKKNHEVIKVDENGNVTTQTFDDSTEETKVTNALAGAKFTLTNDTTKKVYTATTDANGYFTGFTGLDAGTYTLQETVAPNGYSVDASTHTVVISAEYNTDGTLKDYSIAIDGKNTSTYTATYDATQTINKIDGGSSTTYIKNTKISTLPSTGGMGTYLFTIIGVAVMAFAAFMFFKNRKTNKE